MYFFLSDADFTNGAAVLYLMSLFVVKSFSCFSRDKYFFLCLGHLLYLQIIELKYIMDS